MLSGIRNFPLMALEIALALEAVKAMSWVWGPREMLVIDDMNEPEGDWSGAGDANSGIWSDGSGIGDGCQRIVGVGAGWACGTGSGSGFGAGYDTDT